MPIYEYVGEADPEVCEHAGHEWVSAGGGMLICLVCEREKWDADDWEYDSRLHWWIEPASSPRRQTDPGATAPDGR